MNMRVRGDVLSVGVLAGNLQSPSCSLIVPIFNEEMILPELRRRFTAVIEKLTDSVELILVDDGSRDNSLPLIRKFREEDSRVCYLSFARNFGHQVAITAGLNFARGNAVVVLDGDLQDPPELIPEMLAKWHEGYQVVYAQRRQRRSESWFKRSCAFAFYRILRKLTALDVPTDAGDFCLMDRSIVDILNSMPERNRYIRGLRTWVGFKQTAILFDRDPRFAGQPKYTFRKSFGLAINSVVSFSTIPLRLATYLGLAAAGMAILMAFLILYWRLFQPHSPVKGYTIVAMAFFFLGAAQLVSVGILGEYIGRIYDEVKGRPMYTVKESAGFSSDTQSKQQPGS